MMIEYADAEERKHALAGLRGVEDRVWIQVQGCARVYPIADEDLERETEEKTSAVHFLRFELSEEMAKSLKAGAALSMGVDHDNYKAEIGAVANAVRDSLARDLD